MFFSVAYIFKQFISANLDLFYFLSAFKILKSIFTDFKFVKRTFKFFLPILLWAGVQAVLGGIDTKRMFVNIMKIYLCIGCFCYVEERFGKINVQACIKHISCIFVLLLPIGLLFRTKLLWRMDDLVNSYAKVRLKLFYTEPSELAFYLSIIIIFLLYYIVNTNIKKSKFIILLFVLMGYELSLSAGLGGMVGVLISTFLMLVIKFFKTVNPKNLTFYYFGFFIILGIATTIIIKNDALCNRILDILNGNDSSANYRIQVGYATMKNALINTKMIGVGFGNLNTNGFQNAYAAYGIVEVIANSFMYFITEGGIFAIAYLIGFHIFLLKKINKENIMLKLPLLVFIVFYQIGGGYFTNPLNWVIYGVIAWDNTKDKKIEVN